MKYNPIICALDTIEEEDASALAEAVRPHVGAVKLGLEFFTANGANGVNRINKLGIPVFLDLKFHDIPNTVSRAIAATVGMNMFMMTVHTSGGQAMLRAAIEASDAIAQITGKERPMIVGVTLLTSLDQDDVSMLGFREQLPDQVLRLADLAQSVGLDGVVCSAYEIAALRKHCGDDFKLVVPGIRLETDRQDDQKRVLSPKDAIMRGASYLVIGRPITAARNPAEAAKMIAAQL